LPAKKRKIGGGELCQSGKQKKADSFPKKGAYCDGKISGNQLQKMVGGNAGRRAGGPGHMWGGDRSWGTGTLSISKKNLLLIDDRKRQLSGRKRSYAGQKLAESWIKAQWTTGEGRKIVEKNGKKESDKDNVKGVTWGKGRAKTGHGSRIVDGLN